MTTQLLELTPSMGGWYYASGSAPRSYAVGSKPPPSARRAAAEIVVAPVGPVSLGYGPDGRPRLASSRPRIWLLA